MSWHAPSWCSTKAVTTTKQRPISYMLWHFSRVVKNYCIRFRISHTWYTKLSTNINTSSITQLIKKNKWLRKKMIQWPQKLSWQNQSVFTAEQTKSLIQAFIIIIIISFPSPYCCRFWSLPFFRVYCGCTTCWPLSHLGGQIKHSWNWQRSVYVEAWN